MWPRLTVHPCREQGVADVAHGEYARVQIDRGVGEPLRVAASVEPLVMAPDDAQNGVAEASELFEEPASRLGMLADDRMLVVRQWPLPQKSRPGTGACRCRAEAHRRRGLADVRARGRDRRRPERLEAPPGACAPPCTHPYLREQRGRGRMWEPRKASSSATRSAPVESPSSGRERAAPREGRERRSDRRQRCPRLEKRGPATPRFRSRAAAPPARRGEADDPDGDEEIRSPLREPERASALQKRSA